MSRKKWHRLPADGVGIFIGKDADATGFRAGAMAAQLDAVPVGWDKPIRAGRQAIDGTGARQKWLRHRAWSPAASRGPGSDRERGLGLLRGGVFESHVAGAFL